jgi:hypothetical protein
MDRFYFLVARGQVHECVILIQDKGSVITWDFDVLYHDILFTVFRLAKPLKHISSNSNVNNLTTTKNVTVGQESIPNKPGKFCACLKWSRPYFF